MSSQLLDLIFFHLLCTFYSTLDKQVGNSHKPGDLVDQVDYTACVWSYSEDKPACLRLIMPEFFLQSTNCFHITYILPSFDLNRFFNKG